MRSSSTAAVNKAIGTCTHQPVNTNFTPDTFFSALHDLQERSFNDMLKFIEQHLAETGIQHNTAALVEVLQIINNAESRGKTSSRNTDKDVREVVKFLNKHPDYFRNVSSPEDICNVIFDLMVSIQPCPKPYWNLHLEAVKEINAFVISLLQPQLQTFDNFPLLIQLLERLQEHSTQNKLVNLEFAAEILLPNVFNAIRSVPDLQAAVKFVKHSEKMLEITNDWQSYWRDRNANESCNNPELQPFDIRP